MKKLKKSIKVVALMFVLLFVLTLSGCRKKAEPVEFILSAPSVQINEGKGFSRKDMHAYLIYKGGKVREVFETVDFSLTFKEVNQINGVPGYVNVYKVKAVTHDGNFTSEPIFLVNDKKNAKIPKPLYNISYKQVNDPHNKTRVKGLPNNTSRFIFMNQYGYKYDLASLDGTYGEKGLSVKLLRQEIVGGKTVVKSNKIVLNQSNILAHKESIDPQLTINPQVLSTKDGKVRLKAIYPRYYGKDGIKKGGYKTYRMTFGIANEVKDEEGNTINLGIGADEVFKISHPVFSMGSKAKRPVSKQAANWFDYILVIPVSAIMWLFGFGGSLGAAILFTTIVVRTLAWPIYAKTNNMSTKMQEIQPQIKKIQDKYRGMTDKQSQRAMQMETLQLYRKNKVGIGNFLLPLAQMPIFIAMFQSVQRVYVGNGMFSGRFTRITNAMGFINFTQGGLRYLGKFNYVTFILAILVGVTMFLLQHFSAKKPKYLKNYNQEETEQAKKQKRTTKIISTVMLIMMVIFAFQSNAMAFYWICGNLYSIAQNFIQKAINKKKYLKKNHKSGLEV